MEDLLKQILDEIKDVKSEIKEVKEDQKHMKEQINENTRILKNLEHNSNTHKAELDSVNIKLSKVQGKLISIQDDMSMLEMVTANNMANIAKLKTRHIKNR